MEGSALRISKPWCNPEGTGKAIGKAARKGKGPLMGFPNENTWTPRDAILLHLDITVAFLNTIIYEGAVISTPLFVK